MNTATPASAEPIEINSVTHAPTATKRTKTIPMQTATQGATARNWMNTMTIRGFTMTHSVNTFRGFSLEHLQELHRQWMSYPMDINDQFSTRFVYSGIQQLEQEIDKKSCRPKRVNCESCFYLDIFDDCEHECMRGHIEMKGASDAIR